MKQLNHVILPDFDLMVMTSKNVSNIERAFAILHSLKYGIHMLKKEIDQNKPSETEDLC